MKKELLIVISFLTIWLAWCHNSKIVEIDPDNWTSDEWFSVEQVFNQQIDNAQYINDLDAFLSYKISSITEDNPYTSELSIDVDFDDKSSLQWWIDFSQKRYSKTNDFETLDIEFSIDARESEDDLEPFETSWEFSLLYENNGMYLNLQDFNLFMGEWNVSAKMYTLIWDLLKNKWVDLEINSWWIISLNSEADIKLPHIVWTLRNVLKTDWIHEDSPNFLNGIIELIDIVNSYIDLWISTNELVLISRDNTYFQLWDGSIQRVLTWNFQWTEFEFSLSFIASKNWLQVHLYDIKEYDEDVSKYVSTDSEFIFTITENKKSEYSIIFSSIKSKQKIADFKWKIKYADELDFSSEFVLEPLQLIAWQKISWKLEWSIIQKKEVDDKEFPTISEKPLLLSELLSSIWINL
jgi:hypothetical protein